MDQETVGKVRPDTVEESSSKLDAGAAMCEAAAPVSDPIDLAVSSLSGEILTEMRVEGWWTARHAADTLAKLVPPPLRASYHLVYAGVALPHQDRLRQHVSGDHAEILACLRNMGQIAAGEYFTVCVTGDGIKQFGLRHEDIHGHFSRDPPSDISPDDIQQVVCGYRYAAALLVNGDVRFWGSGADNVYQIPDFDGLRVASLGNCRSVNTTGHVGVVLEDGSVRCWGANHSGQCDVPLFPAGNQAVQVTGGKYHTVALLDDGSLVAWGNVRYLSDWCTIGNDFETKTIEISQVAAFEGFETNSLRLTFTRGRRGIFVDAAKIHNIVLLDDGSFICFGGDETEVACERLKLDAGERRAVAVSAGNHNYIVLLEDGSVITAGRAENDFHRIASTLTDARVVGIAGGEWHCAVLLDDDRVLGWGENSHGEYPEAA